MKFFGFLVNLLLLHVFLVRALPSDGGKMQTVQEIEKMQQELHTAVEELIKDIKNAAKNLEERTADTFKW